MGKKLLIIITLLCVVISLTACGKTANEITSLTEETIGKSTVEPEISAESSASDSSRTQSSVTETDTSNNTAGTPSQKPTDPPVSNAPSQTSPKAPDNPNEQTPSKPPVTSTPSQPPISTPTPSNPPPTPSVPSTPAYEILGKDYQNGVLAGINERRATLGLPLAKLDNTLSDECLVQAKKMADAGYDFHSDHPTGCEGTMKVPYNFPAELMGDTMCNHVADFTYEATIKIGVAVVKKGNSLFAVIQGAA